MHDPQPVPFCDKTAGPGLAQGGCQSSWLMHDQLAAPFRGGTADPGRDRARTSQACSPKISRRSLSVMGRLVLVW